MSLHFEVITFLRLNRFLILLFFYFFNIISICECKKKLKEQDIIQRVLKDYDWRVRPRGSNDSWPGKENRNQVFERVL